VWVKPRGEPEMCAAECLDGGLQLPDEVRIGDPAPGEVDVSDSFSSFFGHATFSRVWKIQQ